MTRASEIRKAIKSASKVLVMTTAGYFVKTTKAEARELVGYTAGNLSYTVVEDGVLLLDVDEEAPE